MSRKWGFKILAASIALMAALAMGLALFAGVGTAVAAPPSEMTTIVDDVAYCGHGKVATLGTAENYVLDDCHASFTLPLLAFGDFVDPNPDPLKNCGRERWRGYLQFPLEELPSHSRIVDAELQVFIQYPYPAPGSVTIGLHRVTEDWDPGSASFVWPGPAYRSPAKWQTVADFPDWYTWDVKQIVKAWARGEPNYGFAFVAKKEGRNSNVFAACPDCVSFPPQNEARLIVTYVTPPGRR